MHRGEWSKDSCIQDGWPSWGQDMATWLRWPLWPLTAPVVPTALRPLAATFDSYGPLRPTARLGHMSAI
eukprot:972504-Karenia_brevis.AAC.1